VEEDRALGVMAAYHAASKDTLADRMGITILEASAERVVGTMPVAGNTQPLGLMHGGASCVLAETLGSLGSALHGGPDRVTVGIEINATHHRAATTGEVTGVATLLHGGRTVTTYEIVISDAAGRRVCTSRLTCLLIDRVPGQAAGGAPAPGDPRPRDQALERSWPAPPGETTHDRTFTAFCPANVDVFAPLG
jgi:1,4-dihydroxy-2-naphthoyl-CoA hydrolase